MKLKRVVATLLTVVVLMGLLPITAMPARAAGAPGISTQYTEAGTPMYQRLEGVDPVSRESRAKHYPFGLDDGWGFWTAGDAAHRLAFYKGQTLKDFSSDQHPLIVSNQSAVPGTMADWFVSSYPDYTETTTTAIQNVGKMGGLSFSTGDYASTTSNSTLNTNIDEVQFVWKYEVLDYLAQGVYASWLEFDSNIYPKLMASDNVVEAVGRLTNVAYCQPRFTVYGKGNASDGSWETPTVATTDYLGILLDTYDIYSETGMNTYDILKVAFGASTADICLDPEAAIPEGGSFEQQRSQLLYAFVLFGDTSNDSEIQIGTRYMSAAEQEQLKQNLVDDQIKDMQSGDSSFNEILWYLQYQTWLSTKGGAQPYTTDSAFSTEGAALKEWWDKYISKAPMSGKTPFFFYDPATTHNHVKTIADATIAVYGQWVAEGGKRPDDWPKVTDTTQGRKRMAGAAGRQAQVDSALAKLQSLGANAGSADYQKTQDMITQTELFVYKFYVAYGIAYGLIGEQYLDLIADNPYATSELSPLYAPPPQFLTDNMAANETDPCYVSYPGVWALVSVYNEYRSIVYNLTNNTAQYISGDGSQNDLDSILSKKDAILMLYNLLQDFNDKEMWKVWNDKRMDFLSPEGEQKSMADVYAFLAAQHAFNGETNPNGDGADRQPWSYFFDSEGLSDSMLTGIKQSATFLPMHTNVYDPATWQDVDTAWLLNYYAKFGYFRKALYIDTAEDAAVAFGNTGGRGQLSVATLEDLLQDKDIVLYLDDNLYNVNTLSELIGKAWDRIGQGEGSDSRGGIDKLGGLITELWEVSMPELAKTAERTTYSSRVDQESANDTSDKWGGLFFSNDRDADLKADKTGSESKQPDKTTTDPADQTDPDASQKPADSQEVEQDPEDTGTVYKAVGKADSVYYYLWPDYVWDETTDSQVKNGNEVSRTTEYTPLFGFAVLSAIYKDDSLKETLNSALSTNTPVFISSGTAPYACESLRNSIYNYMLVRNLEAQIPVDYAANLDMTSPLYMDVFGNILTESGYVVIPSAANATLWGSQYVPRNAAFFSCYGDSFYLPYYESDKENGIYQLLAGGNVALCTVLEDGDKYLLNALRTTDSTVNAAMLSTANRQALEDVADTWAAYIKGGVRGKSAPYSSTMWKMIITEVLRGAPIENIDKQFEGIQTDVEYTRNGLIIADKLETLCNAIAPAGQNASLAIPNPAFIDGIEIIVFFVYKLLILAVLIIWMVNVYLDATGGTIGWRTGAKCIGVVVLVLALIVGVPKIFELSYYESNKLLLQDETEYLLMLNTEKKANGQEIGVSKVRPPETSTTLYLHLADINMPWWDLLSQIGLSAGYKSLDEMYKNYSDMHPLAYSNYATTMNDGIYISIDQLFDSAGIQFSPLSHRIYMTGSDNTPASYYTPYYWFLYSITEEVANWSKSNNAVAYTTKVQKGGELKTLGYSKLYFESEDFMEEQGDYFHLYQIYDIWTERNYDTVPDETLAQLRESQWCSYQNGQMSEKGYRDRIEILQTYAQEWIANNHDMIGRVSDETFLKCFALSCAMEHNRLFNTQRADYLEIQQLSNEDLLRLSIADHNKVMSNSSMSYARFVYTTGGTIACYLAAILELVNLVSSWVKPACTLLVFCIACISIFVLKLILRKGNNSIMGYILTITLMCSVNVLGAGVTKLSMYLPNTGLTPSLCILLQVLVQIAYIFVQLKIVSFALRDWRNIGYQQYEHQFNKLHLPGHNRPMLSQNVLTPRGTTGYDSLDIYRNRHIGRRIRK